MTVWIESDNKAGWKADMRFSIDRPSLTVMADGYGGDRLQYWHIHDDGKAMQTPRATDKPPYRVPTMDEIRAIPNVSKIFISYMPDNPVAKPFYASFGFREVATDEDGEMIAELAL